ncbi:hypothetical protein [Natrinema caseinilyticum]|uniref:hypothetical protein n=1 Tax=Natrinema caseinilyticum TaxID=2961570 RepID=UPI0020C35DA7|nr:hypothetical protein [Natrinema caseinilyticum]
MNGNRGGEDRKETTLQRRRLLQATAGIGTATLGLSTRASAVEPGPGPVEELVDCFSFWDTAPETYPQLDLTVSAPTTRNVPDSPAEVMIYAHGWNSEGANGRDQAITFEHALREDGYEYPVVNAQWESNSLDLAEAGRRADVCGRRLAEWLRGYRDRNPDVTVRLAGLSLGARVPLSALETLDGDGTVSSVSLFGAAVDVTWLLALFEHSRRIRR